MKRISDVTADSRGQMNAAGRGVEVIVGITVTALVGAFLVPVGIEQITSVSTDTWSSGAASLWNILDLVIVLGLFLIFIGSALARQ